MSDREPFPGTFELQRRAIRDELISDLLKVGALAVFAFGMVWLFH